MSLEFARGDGFQLDRLRGIISILPPGRRRLAVDGGAHVGSWSILMATAFRRVLAFEPHPEIRQALEQNLLDRGVGNVEVSPFGLSSGLGSAVGDYDSRWQGNSGGAFIIPVAAGQGPIATVGLDHLHLPDLDFLKLDVEGMEYDAIQGSADTLRACRPHVMVELKDRLLARRGRFSIDVVSLMTSLGAREIARWNADVLFAFD